MTLPMPGSAGPSGARASGTRGDPRETYLSPATPVGRPPWDEMPRSVALAPPQEAPQVPDPGPEPHQEDPQGRKARPGTAAPARHSPPRGPADRRAIAAGALALLGAATALFGLFEPYEGSSFWASAQFWSGFAAFCALVQLAPLARPAFGWPARRAWSVGAAGVAGLLLFWVLVVLPAVPSNSSFVVTAAVAAAAGGSWLAPGRRI